MNDGLVYKIFTAEQAQAFDADGVFHGAPLDATDGYIHLSAADQLPATLDRHFAGQTDLVVVGFAPEALGADLRWEPSRGGALFPHLYAPLTSTAARDRWRVVWDGARHQLALLSP